MPTKDKTIHFLNKELADKAKTDKLTINKKQDAYIKKDADDVAGKVTKVIKPKNK